ncbi:GIN domain-containing protein [Pedobacter sp. AW1-32]|uniref:GIN domain-containing protein n=1 Tax=Pedobacter sp. AW1-32 TaxID=3383026 RepID=UPI003FF0E231
MRFATPTIDKAIKFLMFAFVLLCLNAKAAKKEVANNQKISPFRKVCVSGYVEVVLIQRANVDVVYADDNKGNARVTQQGDVLRITGTGKLLVKIIVYVNDLYRIEANEHAKIINAGALNSPFLQIILKGNACANICSQTKELYTSVLGGSKLVLKGKTENHVIVADKMQLLTFDGFTAGQINCTRDENVLADDK